MSVNRKQKDIVSYVLTGIWIMAMLIVKSVLWTFVIAILLVAIFVLTSREYYNGLPSAAEKKQYLTAKLTLAGIVLLVSTIYYLMT